MVYCKEDHIFSVKKKWELSLESNPLQLHMTMFRKITVALVKQIKSEIFLKKSLQNTICFGSNLNVAPRKQIEKAVEDEYGMATTSAHLLANIIYWSTL